MIVEPLTEKAQEVLRYLAAVLATEEIAITMFVSVHTVKTHVRDILRKPAASRRNEANPAGAGASAHLLVRAPHPLRMVTPLPVAAIVVRMKAMVLLSGEERRLLRAAVVGGLGAATDQPVRPGRADLIDEHEPAALADRDQSPRDGRDAGQREIRRG